jgi:hypothetical protein
MAKTIANYHLIETISAGDMNAKVNEMITEGWQPLGPCGQVCGGEGNENYYYHQTMVLYESES